MNHLRNSLLLFITVLSLAPAFACKCELPPPLYSLAQLAPYDFIALVKITGDKDYRPATRDQWPIGELTFTTIELFKGNPNNVVLEESKSTSCDLGIDIGEEWLLFAKIADGKLTIFPCDRNRLYQDTNGLKDWQSGQVFNNLELLRRWYNHPVKQPGTEKFVQYYSNGQKEIEGSYVNGKLEGERRVWFPDGKIYGHETYLNGQLNGKSEWYYPTGQLSNEAYYSKGKHCNISRYYFPSVDPAKWKAGDLPSYETIYDNQGRTILFRIYNAPGKLSQENIFQPDSSFFTTIYYHDNGNISFIGYTKNSRSYGEHVQYSKEGLPQKSWIYDKEGRLVK